VPAARAVDEPAPTIAKIRLQGGIRIVFIAINSQCADMGICAWGDGASAHGAIGQWAKAVSLSHFWGHAGPCAMPLMSVP
jgi:hypothetical protein